MLVLELNDIMFFVRQVKFHLAASTYSNIYLSITTPPDRHLITDPFSI